MSKLKQSFLIITMGLALATGLSYAWTGPTANPPENNASAPINVSSVSQYKAGALGIGGLFHAYTNAIVDGNVGIGTVAPKNRLHIKGTNWPALFVDSSDARGGFIGYGNNSKTGWATGMEEDGTWRIESYSGSGDWRDVWTNGWAGKGGTNVIVAKKDGKVGLGTVDPQAVLHIKAGNENDDPWALRIEQGVKPLKGKVLTAVDDSGNAEWVPAQSFSFGGFYTTNFLEKTCRYGNPYTGTCSCPAGFSSSQIDDFVNPPCTAGFYADNGTRSSNCGIAMYQCYKK